MTTGNGRLTGQELADLITFNLNVMTRDWGFAEEVGLLLRNKHRTLQRSVVVFCLGILKGISQQEHTDARNADAIATAKQVTEMVENGDLNVGMFI